jgi:hypothetical protein
MFPLPALRARRRIFVRSCGTVGTEDRFIEGRQGGKQENDMKRLLVTLTVSMLATSSPLYAKGCIKGAVVGAVAGSAVGHGKLGAAAGCAVGHHEANKSSDTKAAPQPSAQPSK